MVEFDFSVKTLAKEGECRLQVQDVTDVTTKTGVAKIVITVVPFDLDGTQYEEEKLWLNKVPKEREYAFWKAVGCPDNLEEAIGTKFGATLSFNVKDGVSYRNFGDFFEVDPSEEFMHVEDADFPF